MKLSVDQLNQLTMIAQQILAPDMIGMNVHVHLSTGLVYDAVVAVVEDICPCVIRQPCSSACTCANACMSGGCRCCSRYGSKEQRLKKKERLRNEN